MRPLNSHVDLVLQAQAGDREAFIQLMREIEVQLYRTAWAIVKQEEDCADALQETMLNAFKSLQALKEPSYFKTWIFRILINVCNQILKKRARTLPFADLPNVVSPSSEYEKIDLWDAVDRLEDKQRLVIVLHYFEDMPLSQVGEVLDLSLEAVKTRLHRARIKLKDSIRTPDDKELIHGESISGR
ncbi:sigma-70 family RNA polymerase sigma factor [Paenibacillus filicis]|uniref:Sigma-70 family RNA polymerase sigma factor n=1 Tax=Paenibacillus filicis TaxID=669464 RepID=A0ABU9DEK9_9BACL